MKVDKFFVLLIVFIIILCLIIYWNFKKFESSVRQIGIPKFELPKGDFPFSGEAPKNKTEFISEDGKLKVEYTSDWLLADKEFLKNFNKDTTTSEDVKVLLFAQNVNIKTLDISFLLIQEIALEKIYSLEEFLEKIKNDAKEKGSEFEIIRWEINDNIGLLEVKYQTQNKPAIHEKIKIFLLGNRAYLVSVFTYDEVWNNIESKANEILNSAQLIQ